MLTRIDHWILYFLSEFYTKEDARKYFNESRHIITDKVDYFEMLDNVCLTFKPEQFQRYHRIKMMQFKYGA